MNALKQWFFGTELQHISWYQRVPLFAARLFYALARDIGRGQLNLNAMSLVYTTVISLVPFLALSFSVLKGFGVHNQIEPFLLQFFEPLGEKGVEVAEKLIGFVDNVQVGVLGVVGFALLLYSVISMMQKIEFSFNMIWHVARGRSFAKRFSDYLSVLLVGPLLLFLSVGMTASLNAHVVDQYLSLVPIVHVLIGYALPYLFMGVAFAFVYRFMPHTHVRFLSALLGGLMTAVVWKIMGSLFGVFMVGSSSHAMVYSAFAAIILFMVWLYFGWLVVLLGSSIAYYHQYPERMLVADDTKVVPHDMLRSGLAAAFLVAGAFAKGKKIPSIESMARDLTVPSSLLMRLFEHLERSGMMYLKDNHEGHEHIYAPARPLAHITIAELASVMMGRDRAVFRCGKTALDKKAVDLLAVLEDGLGTLFGKKTLADVVSEGR